jgi:hypothetical protein
MVPRSWTEFECVQTRTREKRKVAKVINWLLINLTCLYSLYTSETIEVSCLLPNSESHSAHLDFKGSKKKLLNPPKSLIYKESLSKFLWQLSKEITLEIQRLTVLRVVVWWNVIRFLSSESNRSVSWGFAGFFSGIRNLSVIYKPDLKQL